jgi:hypothetical protein
LFFGRARTELQKTFELGVLAADRRTLRAARSPGEEPWHVLADPEGNEFCLLKARLDPL